MPLCPGSQFAEVCQPGTMLSAELGKGLAAGGEVAEHDVQPHAVDAHVGQSLQQTVGIGIQFWMESGSP